MSIALEDLGRAVKQVQNRHHRALDGRLTEIGSSLPQWDALRAIHRNPGGSSHALAEYTFQTDQSFGSLAGRLVEKGLARRSPGKGRAVSYELTEPGRQILDEGSQLADQVLCASFAPLSETDRDALFELLKRLLGSDPD